MQRYSSLGKPSRRTILARMKNVHIKPDSTSEAADDMLIKCGERLQIDPNYNQIDYDKDYIRYGILKLTPKKLPIDSGIETSQFQLHDDQSQIRFDPFYSQDYNDVDHPFQYSK